LNLDTITQKTIIILSHCTEYELFAI